MSHILKKLIPNHQPNDDLANAKKLRHHLNEAASHQVSCEIEQQLAQAQQEIAQLKDEIQQFWEQHEQEIQQKNQEIEKLTQQLQQQLHQQNKHRPKPQVIQGTPLLCYGQESNLYEDEILSFMHKALHYILQNQTYENSRYQHIVQDILNANPLPRNLRAEKEAALQQAMRTYARMDKSTRQTLTDIGFDISEDGRHYKLVFMNDGRYSGSTSKTSSDSRAGKNFAHDMGNQVF